MERLIQFGEVCIVMDIGQPPSKRLIFQVFSKHARFNKSIVVCACLVDGYKVKQRRRGRYEEEEQR